MRSWPFSRSQARLQKLEQVHPSKTSETLVRHSRSCGSSGDVILSRQNGLKDLNICKRIKWDSMISCMSMYACLCMWLCMSWFCQIALRNLPSQVEQKMDGHIEILMDFLHLSWEIHSKWVAKLSGGFKYLFMFTLTCGNDPWKWSNLTIYYFSTGLSNHQLGIKLLLDMFLGCPAGTGCTWNISLTYRSRLDTSRK